jgi:hypothetical protein
MVQIHSPGHLSGLKFNTFMRLFFLQLLSVFGCEGCEFKLNPRLISNCRDSNDRGKKARVARGVLGQ